MMKTSPEVFTPWHYTSANCARFLKKYLPENGSVFDVGTGSGILAIKAKDYGADRVLAVDIQPEAVDLARENCAGMDIEIRQNYLNQDIDEQFDIIVANLYATPAVEFLQYAQQNMKPDGLLFLTLPAMISYLMVEERFSIVEQTEGQEYLTYVLKCK